MFPLEFPLSVLRTAPKNALVVDPFCGRGTTAYAARYLGLRSYGIDSSPVAVAIARAKLASSSITRVTRLAEKLLDRTTRYTIPRGEFWRRAYHPSTLDEICRLRAGLADCNETDSAVLLKALLLGVLHGPMAKDPRRASYLSNQMPRTFAPKPDYAIRFWSQRKMRPPRRSTLEILRRKAERALAAIPEKKAPLIHIQQGDSRLATAFKNLPRSITHVVTSPPYYGLRTYEEDQWLRLWLLGGPESVPYGGGIQVSHESPEAFAASLSAVWSQIARRSSPGLRMIVRFGSIGSRSVDPREIFVASLKQSELPWRITTVRSVGTEGEVRRQVDQMMPRSPWRPEFDFHIRLRPA
jgi:DNA methylase